MASSTMSSRLSPVNFAPTVENGTQNEGISGQVEDEDTFETDILPGARLSDQQHFTSIGGRAVNLTPVIVDFRRLLQSKSKVDIVPGISNRDLLHAVVALYSVSLSEMTPDILYSTVCEKFAKTIILLRDISDSVEDIQKRKESKALTDEKAIVSNGEVKEDTIKVNEKEKDTKEDKTDGSSETDDVFEPEPEKPGKFAEVYSDTESDESEDEDEEEDFSKGINKFLEDVDKRRQLISSHEGPLTPQHIGIEHRLVAAETFKKTYCKSERVIHLTLLAVRRRFRKWGIGKYLISQVKDPSVVSSFDAVVVHADNGAVEFFERYGFSDDIVINHKWSELAEQFTNCTLMCYLPPFTGQTAASKNIPELDIIAMEKEIRKWREKSIEAYKSEMVCVERMRHEIIHLRALVSSQHDVMSTLVADNEALRREKFLIEKEFLNYRFLSTKPSFSADDALADEEDDISAEMLIQQLKRQARLAVGRKASEEEGSQFYVSNPAGNNEPYCHGKDTQDFYKTTQDFYEAMKKDPSVVNNYEVKIVTRAILPSAVEEAISERTKLLHDPNCVLTMYYCGSLQKTNRIQEILKKGFSEEDYTHGEYGRGLYFSKYPSKAAQFSALGKLIMAEVALGKTESVTTKDRARVTPPNGFDAILTPGRLAGSVHGDHELETYQEYIVFDYNQVKPISLLEYSASVV